jgi:hypothetical protein
MNEVIYVSGTNELYFAFKLTEKRVLTLIVQLSSHNSKKIIKANDKKYTCCFEPCHDKNVFVGLAVC